MKALTVTRRSENVRGGIMLHCNSAGIPIGRTRVSRAWESLLARLEVSSSPAIDASARMTSSSGLLPSPSPGSTCRTPRRSAPSRTGTQHAPPRAGAVTSAVW